MKNLLYGAGCLMVFASCSSQTGLTNDQVASLLNSRQFSFQAQRVQPMDASVNRVMTNLPNGSSAQLYSLSYGYGLEVNNNNLSVYLPYFGQSYRPTFGQRDGGIKFDSTDFEYRMVSTKRGYQITLVPHNNQEVQTIYMDVSNSGSASVNINLTNKSSITYLGYLSPISTGSK